MAPGLAGRLVERRWFRLPQPPSSATRRARTPEGGSAFTTSQGQLTVYGRVYGSEGSPTAYLVHGWAGWWQQFAEVVPALLGAGYRVVAYDAPSHGDSPPGRHGARSSRVMEMAQAYADVVRHQGPADLVVAHSMGAMATMWAREAGTAARAYVFLAATASAHPLLDVFVHSLDLGPRTLDRTMQRIERRIGYPFAAFEVADMVDRLAVTGSLPPLLAVHDRDDRMAPVRGTLDIAAAWQGSELELTKGLGHRRILRDAATVDRIAEFAHRSRPACLQ